MTDLQSQVTGNSTCGMLIKVILQVIFTSDTSVLALCRCTLLSSPAESLKDKWKNVAINKKQPQSPG